MADPLTLEGESFDFVKYVASHSAVRPREVLRRLKLVGGFFAMGLVGIVAAMVVLGADLARSEPARLLTALGFASAAVVCVVSAFSAGMLLWGGFVGQYVANLDAKSELMELREGAAEEPTVEPVAVSAIETPAMSDSFGRRNAVAENRAFLRSVTNEVDVVVATLEKAIAGRRPGAARRLRKEFVAIQSALSEIQQTMSQTEHKQWNASLSKTHLQLLRRMGARGAKRTGSSVRQGVATSVDR